MEETPGDASATMSDMPSTPHRQPAPVPSPGPDHQPDPVARLTAALTVRAASGSDGWDRSLALVAAAQDAAAAGESAAAVRLLAEHPQGILRLDDAVRRTSGYRDQPHLGPETNPFGVALASLHANGRVREAAVGRLAALLDGSALETGLVPFLVLRTADWVAPVRDRARAALVSALHDRPSVLLPAALPLTLLLGARHRGDFARRQAVSALVSAGDTAAIGPLLTSPDARLRRFVLESVLPTRRIPLRGLAALATSDGDRHCRALAAEAAVREAVWTEQTDLLRRFAKDAHPEVRVLALTGLLRSGRTAEATPYLGDRSALVRAVARDAVRRAGGDARAWYRAAAATPEPGALAGLAETCGPQDAPLLLPALTHPRSAVRAAAVRALRALDAVDVHALVPLLRDPSSKVIREATAALHPVRAQLPGGLAESLLADRDRAAVRGAGFRLLRQDDPVRRLRTSLRVALDDDPRLARRATAQAAALIRAAHPTSSRSRVEPVPLLPDAQERAELLALAAAAPLLPPRSRQLLVEQLDSAAPAAELLRVRLGPHPATGNPLPEVEVTFTAEDPHAVIARMRDVLLAVLPYAAGEAPAGTGWPPDADWAAILPSWFVAPHAPERAARAAEEAETPGTARPSTPRNAASWWRGLTARQRAAGTPTDRAAVNGTAGNRTAVSRTAVSRTAVNEAAVNGTAAATAAAAGGPLSEWTGLFAPGQGATRRGWRWWDATVRHPRTGCVRLGTVGHPYAGHQALLWLIEAAGGLDVDLP